MDPATDVPPPETSWGRRFAPWAALLLLPVGFGLQQLGAQRPELVESAYSQGLYPLVAAALGGVSRLLPVSLAEVVILALVLTLLVLAVRGAVSLARARGLARFAVLGRGLRSLAGLAGLLYFSYVALWGLNHQRLAFAEVAGWDTSAPRVEELDRVAGMAIAMAKRERRRLAEDESGVALMPYDAGELGEKAREAFERCRDLHPSLGRAPGAPKRPRLSPLLSASWISGVFSPWTGEAHVNDEIPAIQLPFTTCHELAHSLGFAREDEANFLAWLATSRSDDPVLRYSGALAATRVLLRALRQQSDELYEANVVHLDGGMVQDMNAIDDFWLSKRSAATEVAREVNDGYLKSQGQTAGVASYGRMVDLLIAEQRARDGSDAPDGDDG